MVAAMERQTAPIFGRTVAFADTQPDAPTLHFHTTFLELAWRALRGAVL
jgi:hypothetical protein